MPEFRIAKEPFYCCLPVSGVLGKKTGYTLLNDFTINSYKKLRHQGRIQDFSNTALADGEMTN
jgi:hypothetical protein